MVIIIEIMIRIPIIEDKVCFIPGNILFFLDVNTAIFQRMFVGTCCVYYYSFRFSGPKQWRVGRRMNGKCKKKLNGDLEERRKK